MRSGLAPQSSYKEVLKECWGECREGSAQTSALYATPVDLQVLFPQCALLQLVRLPGKSPHWRLAMHEVL